MSCSVSRPSIGNQMRDGSSPRFHSRKVVAAEHRGVLQRRNSLTATMSRCVSPIPTGSPIPLPRSRPWPRPSSWARVGRAKTFPGEPGSTKQKLAVARLGSAAAAAAADGVSRPVSPSARPAPFPLLLLLLLLFCCLVGWMDVPRCAKKTWRAVAWALAGPLLPSCDASRLSFPSPLVGSLGLC
jgi:hypothetical protein